MDLLYNSHVHMLVVSKNADILFLVFIVPMIWNYVAKNLVNFPN